MKRPVILLLLFLTTCSPGLAQGLLLTAGETYTQELASFSFLASGGLIPPGARMGVGLTGLSSGDTMLFEAFENSLSEVPIFSSSVSVPQGYSIYSPELGLAWQDLQGLVRLTMVSGSMTVSSVHATVTFPDSATYMQYISVPEPRMLTPVALGLLWFVLRWEPRVTRRSAPTGLWLGRL